MTVEQYAAFCAECAVFPTWIGQVLGRYQIHTGAERGALDLHWRSRMEGNEELKRLWLYHFGRYEQWYKQNRS